MTTLTLKSLTNKSLFLTLCALSYTALLCAGERPYEMVWANRTHDDNPPLLALTNTTGWRVECTNAQAQFETSQEVLLFGEGVAKLTYHATGAKPAIKLLPPTPVAITNSFDAVSFWLYGNNHSYSPDPKTPPVQIVLNFEDTNGKPLNLAMGRMAHKEWFLIHKRLTPEMIKQVADGARLLSITVDNCTNDEPRTNYFNSLAVFTEKLAPLTFAPRKKRGVTIFPTCPTGNNVGPDALPFPNTPLTIIPRDPAPAIVRVAQGDSGRYYLIREGEDGRLEVRLPTKLGSWDDLAMRWSDSEAWKLVALDGGLYFANPEGEPQRAVSETTAVTTDGKSVLYQSTLTHTNGRSVPSQIRFQLVGKSLVVDLQAPGGEVAEVRFGKTQGFEKPDITTLPYYTYSGYGAAFNRPLAIISGTHDKPLFFMAHIDWTQSNASTPFAGGINLDGSIASNGGTRYQPKTDGQRNDCYERFVLTMAPRFEEVLPNIPNPTSPWKHITGKRVWRPHGAHNRDNDAKYWRGVHRWGMTQMVVTDHETGWRDGNESFTFRTAPAPKKGGDEGQFKYARIMQDELGFVYGPYNNFTDFAPVNGFWSYDMISRTQESQLQHAWTRCYAPKPARAVEYCERLAPIIQKKFNFSTAYCDVHTAVTPWSRVDYDARVPGAGTFAAVYYAYGEIMLLQKAAWQGPVYSEGNNHFSYCGLTDGNYAQDQSYRISENPWLVDFDLRSLHDLCCNFGMGSQSMFYPGKSAPTNPDTAADRFLAATVAFGHPGFLLHSRVYELRSYYMLQALAAHYTQSSVKNIRYMAADSTLYTTSQALRNRAYERSQLVTRYADDTLTVVNGNPDERMRFTIPADTNKGLPAISLDLPPNGYWGRSGDGTVRIFSGEVNGHRADLSHSPNYLYMDGRGVFTRWPEGASAGAAIMLTLTNNFVEILLHKCDEAGFAGTLIDAVALDESRNVMGPAEIRHARGLSYILPVKGAFSYRARRLARPPLTPLTAAKDVVSPGERITITGQTEHVIFIPADAKPGERLWITHENGWIDFTVATPPPAAVTQQKRGITLPRYYLLGMAMRNKPECELNSQSGANIRKQHVSCGGVGRDNALFMHPPYIGGTGYAFALYTLDLPTTPQEFECEVGKMDGSDLGDGILYKIIVEDSTGKRSVVAEKQVTDHAWHPLKANLKAWAGQEIKLILVADVGTANNSSGDWAAWSEMRLLPLP